MFPLKCLPTLLLTIFLVGQAYADNGTSAIDFDIRRQPIGSAIADFGLQSGAIIALGEHQRSNILANRIKGRMTLEQALQALLADTGYSYELLTDRSIRVFRIPPPAEEPKSSGLNNGIEEVTITAQKRAQPPLEVPMATSVFTAEQLETYNISNIDDIATLTPGLVSTRFSYANPTFTIRGAQNTFSSVGTSEPTGVFVDEIYISRFSASDLRLYDLSQAVIARGPQGTLFGRNVTSGAILLFTKPPQTEQQTASISLSAGNKHYHEIKGTANLPIGTWAAAKISGVRSFRDGFGKDLLADREQDDLDSGSARLQLLANPNRETNITFSLDRSQDKNSGRTLSSLRRSDIDIRESALNIVQRFDRDISGASLKINRPIGEGELTSITGYRKADSDEIFSRSDLAFSLIDNGFQEAAREVEEPETLSQEIRYVSGPGERYSFIAGVYLFYEDSDRRTERTRLAAITGAPLLIETIDQSVITHSYALYFDNTISLTSDLNITIGARQTYEKKDAWIRFRQTGGPATNFTERADESWEKLTPRMVLSWQPKSNTLIYASYTEGFTAGGFNTEATNATNFSTPFDPEKSDAFELGTKISWANNTLITNAVLFRQRYIDKQEFVRPDIASPSTILNASRATIEGAELEAFWNISKQIRLTATYAYLDGTYDSFDLIGEPDRASNRLAGSPRHQYSLSLDAATPFYNGNLAATLSWAWQDRFFPSSSNTRFFPSYGLLDARIAYKTSDRRFGLTLWANNLADEEYQLATTGFADADAAWYAPPRTFGVTFEFLYSD